MTALQACRTVGMPGCRALLSETVVYLAEAPKSTRAYEGYNCAEKLAKRDMSLSVPLAMRDVPVGVMDALEGYKYPPEYRCAFLVVVWTMVLTFSGIRSQMSIYHGSCMGKSYCAEKGIWETSCGMRKH
jgi:hypothetical protein